MRATHPSASSRRITPNEARTMTRRHCGSRSITFLPVVVAIEDPAPVGDAHRSPIVLT